MEVTCKALGLLVGAFIDELIVLLALALLKRRYGPDAALLPIRV
jgi:hypothetical protein